jgi:D-xylose transport system substrate-binding protein
MRQVTRNIIAATVLAVIGTVAVAEDKVFFLPNTTTTRFESRDAPLFVEAMKKNAPRVTVR